MVAGDHCEVSLMWGGGDHCVAQWGPSRSSDCGEMTAVRERASERVSA